MKTILLFFLTITLSTGLYADELITDFKEDSVPVLNEELRKLDDKTIELKKWIGTNPPSTLTISGGVVTAIQYNHNIATEAAGASDDLDTINGGNAGALLFVAAADSAKTVVLKDGTGNLKLAGDCTLDNSEDSAFLVKVGSNWKLIACTSNGA